MLDILTNSLASAEHPRVVLLDHTGARVGTAEKASVHHERTPFHLAFSCYVVRRGTSGDDQVLLTRRAPSKRTWPGVWTNACCGHPAPGETLRSAVTRHLRDELGVRPVRLAMALPDFTYRAEMEDGTVEHELCPVVVAAVDGELHLDPDEAADATWVSWPELVRRGRQDPGTLSPWSVRQIARLDACAPTIGHWLDRHDASDHLLDRIPGERRRGGARVDTWIEPTAAVDAHLAGFLRARRDDVPEAQDAIGVLHRAISGLTDAGGKRLRPAFVLWGHAAAGGSEPAAVAAAAAVEMLHTFALLHDDVMDRSAVRRGRPTAQHALRARPEARHPADEWFGISAAILAGDLAFVWADRLFDQLTWWDGGALAGRPERHAREHFSTLRTEVIAGQYLDLRAGVHVHAASDRAADAADAADAPATEAVRIALLKTARYTATRPLQIGAALAGAESEVCERLAAFGDAVGVAFQLRDDVLGTFGSAAVTGKSTDDDLREGKRTLLLERARDLTTDAGRRTLDTSIGRADLDEVAAQRCRDVIAASGALASVEAAIEMHLERALAHATTFDRRATDALVGLAHHAAHRDA